MKKVQKKPVFMEAKNPGFIRSDQQTRNQVEYWQSAFVSETEILQTGRFLL
jgi:hypothetical protein